MSKFWKRRIKDTESIANKMGVEEEKIKELVNGEREIEGKTLDKVLKAVEEEKINKPFENVEILQWYRDTDITALRKKFGYKSQGEFAKKIGYDVSVICRIENKKLESQNKSGELESVPDSLRKVYYFFNDDFNRKIETEKEEKTNKIFKWYKNTNIKKLRGNIRLNKKAEEIGIPTSSLNDIEHKKAKKITDNIVKVYNYYLGKPVEVPEEIDDKYRVNLDKKTEKEIWKWYKKTDIRDMRNYLGLTQSDISKKIGMSQPCIGDVENKKNKSVTPTMVKLYEFYNNLEVDKTNPDNEIMDWYKSIQDFGEYRREFGYSKNKFMAVLNLSYDQIRDFERHNYKSVTPIVKKIYEFYHNEENRLPEIEWQPDESNTWVKKPIVVDEVSEVIEDEKPIEEVKDCDYKQMYETLKEEFNNENQKLIEAYNENYKLKMQIARYEKLIDRL